MNKSIQEMREEKKKLEAEIQKKLDAFVEKYDIGLTVKTDQVHKMSSLPAQQNKIKEQI